MKRTIFTQEQENKIIELYTSGKAVGTIVKEIGLDKGAIRRLITEKGLLRTKGEAQRIAMGISYIKKDAFDIPTPDALYWIGFLYADGHIEKSAPRITLTLGEKDRGHLEKWNEFMGGKLNIIEVAASGKAKGQVNFDKKYYRVAFAEPHIHSKLQEFGFTHNKTLALDPHPLLKNSRDFWRGVIDGDGWVCKSGDKRANGKYNYPTIGLSGTEQTTMGFITFMESMGIRTMCIPSKRKGANVWQIDLHGDPAFKICKLLYQNSSTYLDRKYQQYIEFIQ